MCGLTLSRDVWTKDRAPLPDRSRRSSARLQRQSIAGPSAGRCACGTGPFTGGCNTAWWMAAIDIPFVARGTSGRALIEYGVNDDPARWGYRLVGLPFDIECARGCPVLEATVDYPALGYAAQLGWIQTIQYGVPGAPQVAMVDAPPQMADAGIPWAAWGVRPTLFDAPSTSELEFRFRAQTFLAASADAVMTRVVEPLCGFSWGYDVHDGVPAVAPIAVNGFSGWRGARELLASHCPGWTFLESRVR
jgi:hypothetical protein